MCSFRSCCCPSVLLELPQCIFTVLPECKAKNGSANERIDSVLQDVSSSKGKSFIGLPPQMASIAIGKKHKMCVFASTTDKSFSCPVCLKSALYKGRTISSFDGVLERKHSAVYRLMQVPPRTDCAAKSRRK